MELLFDIIFLVDCGINFNTAIPTDAGYRCTRRAPRSPRPACLPPLLIACAHRVPLRARTTTAVDSTNRRLIAKEYFSFWFWIFLSR